MSINILDSTPVPLSKVPQWVEEHAGFKPNRSTVFRWTKRGAKGRKLATFNAGGRKCTTVEALLEFFSGEDESSDLKQPNQGHSEAEAFLASEGF